MQLSDAISLIQHDAFHPQGKQSWADLGCGSGLFTQALARILQPKSTIYAIDNDLSALNKIAPFDKVDIKTQQANFITDDLNLSPLNGILMANSLHYVKNKKVLLQKLHSYLKENHSLLIIEYDTDKPVSTWVPYPIRFASLRELFTESGYTSVTKMHERASIYRTCKIYSAVASR